jgi:ParB family chromosome partitioning protein
MAFQGDSIYWVEVEKVVPNPFQPRVEFHEGKLQELADSIRMYGVLQPLTVTRSEVQRDDGTFYTKYELIAGERRLRASKLANIAQVPVIIREGEENEQEKLELAIIENLQREDLNAVDRALAFKQLAETFELSHALVAKKMGRSREYVSNSIRLLGLPNHMLNSLKHAEMMEGHARTLLMLTDRPEEQEVVYKEILLKKLSVREVERIVRKIATDKVRKKNSGEFDASLISLEKRFTDTLGTRVQIQKTDFGGKLTIDYFSEEDLETILKRMREEAGVPGVPMQAAEKVSAATGLDVHSQKSGSDTAVVSAHNPTATRTYPESPVAPAEPHQEESLGHFVSRAEAVPEPVPEPVSEQVSQTPSVQNHSQVQHHDHEPLPVIPEPEQHTDTTHNQNSSHRHEAPVTNVSAPVASDTQDEPDQKNKATSFFHHAVTDLFGTAREAQTYEPVTAEPEVSKEAESHVENSVDQKPEDDDDEEVDLYSMRNFSV